MFLGLEIDIFSAGGPGVWFVEDGWLDYFILFLSLACVSFLLRRMLMILFLAIKWWSNMWKLGVFWEGGS